MRSSVFAAVILIFLPPTIAGQNTESLGDTARRLRAEKIQKSQPDSEPKPSGSTASQAVTSPNTQSKASADEIADINALGPDDYGNAIAELLASEKFEKLDRIASNARETKARFAGGGWKLRTLYVGLCGKCQERRTGTTIEKSIEHLKRWIAAVPDSITARVALADNYLQYAWLARGDDYADMVDESSWKVFEERLAMASQVLEGARSLKEKCPQWFLIQQRVARAQGKELPELTELARKAAAFEPLYYYFYQEHSYTLEPKWSGEEGDSQRYATQVADEIGGAEGAIIYYKIATSLYCTGCSEAESDFQKMSWKRIQDGYAALQKKYGTSKIDLNAFAHLATRAQDREVAAPLFFEIGENWDRDTWRTRQYFESSRGWAIGMSDDVIAQYQKMANDAMEPSAGKYLVDTQKLLQQQNANLAKLCKEQVDGGDFEFDVLLKVDTAGNSQRMSVFPKSKFSDCIVAKLQTPSVPPPPHGDQLIPVRFGTKSFVNHSRGATLPEAGR